MAWSEAVTILEPASEPVSIAEAKEFVSIENEIVEFDTLLSSFIGAARAHLEAMTGTRLIEQTVELHADSWADLLSLPIGPVSAIVAIAYDDIDGAEQVVDAAVYELTGAGLARGIRTAVGQVWPSDHRRSAGAIRVQLTLGYSALPKPLWTAMLLMVGDLFANRENGVGMPGVPADLISNYRIWL